MTFLKSKNYKLSVGFIGKLECDFIARANYDDYYYIQVSKDITNKDTEEREYRPFYVIKELYPSYLFTMDMLLQKRDSVNHVNIVDFIYNKENKSLLKNSVGNTPKRPMHMKGTSVFLCKVIDYKRQV